MQVSVTRAAVFLSVLGTVSALLHGYAWLRLVRDPAWGGPIDGVLGIVFLALTLLLPLAMVGMRVFRSAIAVPLAWVGYLWLGTLFYLDVILVVLDLARWGVGDQPLASLLGGAPSVPRAEALAALTLGGAVVGLGISRGLRDPIIRRVEVAIEGLPEAFRGFRIVQLTDVHIGPLLRRDFADHIVKAVAKLEPDLIAVTGDLVDGSVAELASEVEPFRALAAPHGVFFVTGNHEYFSGADAWAAHLETMGMHVLRNRHLTVVRDGAALVVAGVDDAHAPRLGGRTDLPGALEGRDPHAPVVLLAHQPRTVVEAAAHGVALQLSGHTHGGQMQPFGALVRVEQPFLKGLHRIAKTQLWVSEGTGTWGPPLRVGTRSEISVIELTPRAIG